MIQANTSTVLQGGTQYVTGSAPVNSIVFSKNSQFICAGLDDGSAKIWNTQNKALAANLLQPATTRYTSENHFSPITAISLNSNNKCLGTSNRRGIISLYRTETIFDPEDGTDMSWKTQNVEEYSRIQVQTDGGYGGSINEI